VISRQHTIETNAVDIIVCHSLPAWGAIVRNRHSADVVVAAECDLARDARECDTDLFKKLKTMPSKIQAVKASAATSAQSFSRIILPPLPENLL